MPFLFAISDTKVERPGQSLVKPAYTSKISIA